MGTSCLIRLIALETTICALVACSSSGGNGAQPGGGSDGGTSDAALEGSTSDATMDGEPPADGASPADARGDTGKGPSDGGADADGSSTGAPSGQLDPTFGSGGKLVTNFGVSGDEARAIAVQSDGKIVVSGKSVTREGTYASLVRYLPDGSIDTTFGAKGSAISTLGTSASGVALQSDGKIVASIESSSAPGVERFNADGSVDSTFGMSGFARLAGASSANAVAVQPDGKIVAAGSTGGSSSQFVVGRFGTDGTPDATFNGGGTVTSSFSGGSLHGGTANALALQTSGTTTTAIVVAGVVLENPSGSGFLVARLLGADGSFDASFGSGGYVWRNSFSVIDTANAVAVQSDGKIVVGGVSESGAPSGFGLIVRYTTSGAEDSTFGTSGELQIGGPSAVYGVEALAASGTSSFVAAGYSDSGMWGLTAGGTSMTAAFGSGRAYGVALQSDGNVVMAGGTQKPANAGLWIDEDFGVARFDGGTGQPDTTFASGGAALTNVVNTDDELDAVALQPDGKIVAAGGAFNGANMDTLIARLNPDGSLDTTFGKGGVVVPPVDLYDDDVAYGLLVEPGGGILAVGWLSYTSSPGSFNEVVVHLEANGSLDTTFGGVYRGYTIVDYLQAAGVAERSDGRILLAGGPKSFSAAQLLPEGGLDKTGFGPDGGGGLVQLYPAQGPGGRALALLDGGSFLVAGETNEFAIYGFQKNGVLDPTFGDAGFAGFAFGGSSGAYGIAVQSTGKLVTVGQARTGSASDYALARLAANGSLDTTFGTAGQATTDVAANDSPAAVVVQADDKILVAGQSSPAANDFVVLRYGAAGSLDPAFGTAGIAAQSFGGSSSAARAVALQSDRKLVAVGLTNDGVQSDSCLVRLTP